MFAVLTAQLHLYVCAFNTIKGYIKFKALRASAVRAPLKQACTQAALVATQAEGRTNNRQGHLAGTGCCVKVH